MTQAVASTAVAPGSRARASSFCESTGQKTHAAAAAPAMPRAYEPRRVGLKTKSTTMPASGAARPSRMILRVAVSGESENPATKYTAVAKAAATASPPRRKRPSRTVTSSPATKGAAPPWTAGLASRSLTGNRIGERRALAQLGEMPREIDLILPPVHLGIAEIEPARAHAHGDIAERVAVPRAPGLVAQLRVHRRQPGAYLAHLAIGPGGVTQLRLALVLQARGDPGVEHAVGKRFPAPHLDALARVGGNQPQQRRGAVEEGDDDARVEKGRAVVEHQHRHLSERIEIRRDRVGLPRIVDRELVLDLLLREHDADLARERTGERTDELHAADSTRSGPLGVRSQTGFDPLPQLRHDVALEPGVSFHPQPVSRAGMR